MPITYPDAVQWYYAFARFPNAPRLSDERKLERMEQILARLGNPHRQFPSLLIAGTKGKGSTAALLESVLRAAGYRTGLYTSPHLHTFRERFRVNGELVTREQVIRGTEQLQQVAVEFPYATFFEWVTALGLAYFASQNIEIAVVEVGLGGRLDCTNVLTPRVSVITPISYDHMEILGHTLDAIAREKAGIIKPNVPVVVAPQAPEAREAILAIDAAVGAPLVNVAQEWRWRLVRATPQGQVVDYRPVNRDGWETYVLPLLGPHQRVNLAAALATLNSLRAQGWRIPADAVQQGIASVEWHVRFEILDRDPAVVADGAHNRASAHELVRTLDEVFPGAPVHFIFGASDDKDIAGMLEELTPCAASITFTQSHHTRAAAPDALAALFHNGIEISSAADVSHALEHARAAAAAADVICVTGSLFVASEARALILPRRGIPIETDA